MNIGSICGKVYLFNTHFLFVCFQDIYPDNITSLDKYLSSSCEKTKLRRKTWQIISLGFCIKKIVLRKLFMKLFPHYLYTPGQHWDQRTRKFHQKYCKNNTLLLYKKKKNCEISLYHLIHWMVDRREWSCGHFDAKIK